MIDSGLYSKSIFRNQSQILIEEKIDVPILNNTKKINKSILFHFYHSYIKNIYGDLNMSMIQKHRSCQELGFLIGHSFAQEQSQGYIKTFFGKSEKQPKPFIAEMKLLYAKIWTTVFDSTAKLYKIPIQQLVAYKIQDKQFTFTKALNSQEPQLKQYKVLVYEFVKGVIEGFLQKFDLRVAQITYNQVSDNSVNFQIKDIFRKQ